MPADLGVSLAFKCVSMHVGRLGENNSSGGGVLSLKHTDSRAAALGEIAGALGADKTLNFIATLR